MVLTNAEYQKHWRAAHPEQVRERGAVYHQTHRVQRNRQSEARKKCKRADYALSDAHRDSIKFVAFDGEGSDGLYYLFASSVTDRYIADKAGLSTKAILGYIVSLYREKAIRLSDALVGYGLSYDFDNILRDVPDEAYQKLLVGEEVWYAGYKLKLIERKMLVCTFRYIGNVYKQFVLQDVFGYFQTSFLNACDRWHVELPQMVEEYKAKRGTFDWSDIDNIIKYNRMELQALVTMMDKLKASMFDAFRVVSVKGRFEKSQWYGPGSQAQAFLQATALGLEQPIGLDRFRTQVLMRYQEAWQTTTRAWSVRSVQLPHVQDLVASNVKATLAITVDPWAAAYYGGRIECGMKGHITGSLYDYDIASAYPFALTTLPTLKGRKLIHVKELDTKQRLGVYYLWWRNKRVVDYNPFPYRARDGGVCFPNEALGWYMSPEVMAVAETMSEPLEIVEGFVVEGTEGYANGLRSAHSPIATLIRNAADHRIRLKQENNDAHVALKLMLNSVYGKTLQSVGNTKHRNGLVGAWITSVCRAMLWRAIAKMPRHTVLFMQTDGILTTRPILKLALSDSLGGWSVKQYDEAYVYQPGIYELLRNGESMMERVRGIGHADISTFRGHYADGIEVRDKLYVTRKLALAAPITYGPYVHRFIEVVKTECFPLDRKRIYADAKPMQDMDWANGTELCWYRPLLDGYNSVLKPKGFRQASYPYMRVLLMLDEALERTLQAEVGGAAVAEVLEAVARRAC